MHYVRGIISEGIKMPSSLDIVKTMKLYKTFLIETKIEADQRKKFWNYNNWICEEKKILTREVVQMLSYGYGYPQQTAIYK